MSASRIAELRSLILKAKQAYYFGDQPRMTDLEFDGLEDELRRLAPDDDVLARVGAPVSPKSLLSKARHGIPMGSQAKVNSEAEFTTWYKKMAENGTVHASLKGDGASAAAYYREGRLEQVISRGDGSVGEDITANAICFKGLPAFAAHPEFGPFTGAVRFEVILTKKAWKIVDPSTATNPRNLGTGIMGRKDGKNASLLSVYAFDVVGKGIEARSESAKSQVLVSLGFSPMPYRTCGSLDECVAYYSEVVRTRSDLPFWIDGVVVKIDSIAYQESLGATSGRPKGQLAWKFASEGHETFVRSYVISGGHTGVLVPTAGFDPVELGGTTVRNAVLNNWEEIERLDVAIGDRVWVVKANDIIPKIIEVRERALPGDRVEIKEPRECPFCGSPTGRRRNVMGGDGAATICLNRECPQKTSGKIKRWIQGLDILGIGDSLRQALIDQMNVEDPSGLYLLEKTPETLAEVVINRERGLRLGTKRAKNVLHEIEKKKRPGLALFLGSLGIEGLGERRVELMVKASAGELDSLEEWRRGRLRDEEFSARCGVPNLGDRIQDGIDALSMVIDRLLAAGVTATYDRPISIDPVDGGETICITGKLPSGKKKTDYAGLIAQVGYRLVSTVSTDLDFLVLADPESKSAKTMKAKKLGVMLLSEEQLVAMLES